MDLVIKDYLDHNKDTYFKNLFIEDFINNFFNKYFLKGVEDLKEMKQQINKKISINTIIENLDLILKIIEVKFQNNMTPLLVNNFISLLDSFFFIINENKYKLNDIESYIIIYIQLEKITVSNNNLKEHLFKLLNQFTELIDGY